MTLPSGFNLTGRTALISGAGSPSGIGYAAALSLGELGAKVVITATTARVHERVTELQAHGVDAIGFVARLDSEALVANLAQALAAASIVPDILVNNAGMIATADAGIDGASAAMLSGDISMSVDEWHRGLTMNLTSAFLLTRAVIPAMRHNGWGRIVTVSSVSGALMATRGDVAYATAKAALLGMTRALAVDEAHHGITANAVAPGWIATGSQLPDEASEGYRVPLGRSGTAAEVGSAIAWLASPGASYVTGQLITVDGGNSVAEERL